MAVAENKTGFERFQTGFLYFWVYAALGWIYEVFLEVVVYRWDFPTAVFCLGRICRYTGLGRC